MCERERVFLQYCLILKRMPPHPLLCRLLSDILPFILYLMQRRWRWQWGIVVEVAAVVVRIICTCFGWMPSKLNCIIASTWFNKNCSIFIWVYQFISMCLKNICRSRVSNIDNANATNRIGYNRMEWSKENHFKIKFDGITAGNCLSWKVQRIQIQLNSREIS